MKHLLYAVLMASVLISCDKDDPQPEKQMSMGKDYSNDIYYSLKNGEVSNPTRAEWDIAFYTDARTSTIITNDGSGVELSVWPNGAKADWANVTDAGMENWPKLYNTYSDSTWQNGAFDKNATGHPDYGWGVYSSSNHSVVGDSIHIIKLTDGNYKKLLIEKREASNNTFYIKYANLDGTNEKTAEIPCGTSLDKNFVHFSIVNNQVISHEPAKAKWDLVFTRYIDQISMGGPLVPYPVVGVLLNNDVTAAVTDSLSTNYLGASYSKALNTIGSRWKVYDPATGIYSMRSNTAYFVKDRDGKYYKIQFTKFEGSSTGNLDFEITKY